MKCSFLQGAAGAFVLALMQSALAANYTNYRYHWTNATGDGDFNNEANWEEESYVLTSKISPTYLFPDKGAVNGTVKLTDDFAVNHLAFTNESGQATATLDLQGHQITVSESYRFQIASPLVLSNGAFKVSSIYTHGYWGRPDVELMRVRFEDMSFDVPEASKSTYAHFMGPRQLYFKDSYVTNFPSRTMVGSDAEVTYDNCIYSKSTVKMHFGPTDGMTNTTVRFSNGSTVDRWDYQYSFECKPSAVNNRIVVDSGAYLPFIGRSSATIFTLDGTNNVFAISNACANGFISLAGVSNTLIFSHAAYTNDASAYGIRFDKSIGNRMLFDEPQDLFRLSYLDFAGANTVDPLIELADNTVISNRSFNFRPYDASGMVVRLGTNSILRIGYPMMESDKGGLPSNALYEVNADAKLLVDTAYTRSGFCGSDLIIRLNNGMLNFTHNNAYLVISAGTRVELNGDRARLICAGYTTFGKAYDAYPGLIPVVSFRPGPTGYCGEAPFRVRKTGYNTMATNTVFEADLRDYIRDKTTRHHRIPLITGKPSEWDTGKKVAVPDLDRLTETLIVKPVGHTKNERLVYDADLNAICLDFDLIVGLMILVR